VEAYAERTDAKIARSFTEVESGKFNTRPELAKALHLARVTGVTLTIAKLDRLSRNAAFLLTLRDSGVRFIAADMPDANELTVGIMALVAQQEREAISKRTKEALAAAKRRGAVLGNPKQGVEKVPEHAHFSFVIERTPIRGGQPCAVMSNLRVDCSATFRSRSGYRRTIRCGR
jgi:DNA invertase Pin-like site-specific DNA recombinase